MEKVYVLLQAAVLIIFRDDVDKIQDALNIVVIALSVLTPLPAVVCPFFVVFTC